jgi:hypothetical protein
MNTSSAISENAATIDHFPSVPSHVNYCILFALMQFGHGFRHALHAAMDMGASKTMTTGVNSIALSGDLSAGRLAAFSDDDVDAHFHLPHVSELDPLRGQVRTVITRAGMALMDLDHDDFFSLALSAIEGPGAGHDPLANLARSIVNTIPAFMDVGISADGKPVYLFKKVQLAICELHRTVGTTDKRFNFPDINRLRAVVDNVIPAMLAKHGVLRLSDRLAKHIQSRVMLPRGVMETGLRSATVVACEQIVESCVSAFTNVELSTYLWLLGKVGDNRQWERHYTTDTIFY